jgi:hypothetical protein
VPTRTRHISHAFLGRNSLLAGNLTGNLRNRADLLLFGLSWDHDCAQHQEVRREFGNYLLDTLFRRKQGIPAGEQ